MKEKKGNVLLFDKRKYQWLIIGLVVTAIGFLLMIGGSSDDPEVFSDAIFNFRRLTLAPILVLAGYAIQIYAIMKKTTNVPDSSDGAGSSGHPGRRQAGDKPSRGASGESDRKDKQTAKTQQRQSSEKKHPSKKRNR